MTSSERGGQSIHPETATDAGPSRSDTWIERVKEADAQAEVFFLKIFDGKKAAASTQAAALIAIAAELRAQRIARRPGAGQ